MSNTGFIHFTNDNTLKILLRIIMLITHLSFNIFRNIHISTINIFISLTN